MLNEKLVSAISNSDMVKTKNGALAHRSAGAKNLDLFFKIGALRFKQSSEEIVNELFTNAIDEDPYTAYQILCWSRDCRGGAGAKLPMATILDRITNNGYTINEKVIEGVISLGYWRDIFNLYDVTSEDNQKVIVTFCKRVITEANREDLGLFSKWFPRRDKLFYDVAKALEWPLSKLRKFISSHSNTVEQKLCAREFNDICFSAVPGVAMLKYTNAFRKHCKEQFNQYLEEVEEGKQKINASILTPLDIINKLNKSRFNPEEYENSKKEVDILWDNLEDTLYNSDKIKLLPVCDVSDSMFDYNGIPMFGSIGLGLYIAQRNRGALKNKVITFSEQPTVYNIKSQKVSEAYEEMLDMDWGFNTNIDNVFKLILDTAKLAGADFMPTHIIIFSDMQFDKATNDKKTNFQHWSDTFKKEGYELPKIIFWNLASRSAHGVPVTKQDNALLISGYSPAIMKDLLQNADVDAIELMRVAIDKDKYKIFE